MKFIKNNWLGIVILAIQFIISICFLVSAVIYHGESYNITNIAIRNVLYQNLIISLTAFIVPLIIMFLKKKNILISLLGFINFIIPIVCIYVSTRQLYFAEWTFPFNLIFIYFLTAIMVCVYGFLKNYAFKGVSKSQRIAHLEARIKELEEKEETINGE